jgi:hypothetical protein
MRDPRIFLEEFRSSQNARDGVNPITHLRDTQTCAYGAYVLVTVGIAFLLVIAFGNGWL